MDEIEKIEETTEPVESETTEETNEPVEKDEENYIEEIKKSYEKKFVDLQSKYEDDLRKREKIIKNILLNETETQKESFIEKINSKRLKNLKY